MSKRRKENKWKDKLPFRLNLLFFVMFIMFAALILQLGAVQILRGESFQEEIDRTVNETTKVPVPRGKIYDSNQQLVVGNEPLYAITYTPAKGTQAADRLEVAEKLAKLITIEVKGISERDKKEYYYLNNKDKVVERLSQEEKKKLDDVEEYDLALERITETEMNDISEHDKLIIVIKKELDKAYALTPQIIKNEGVTAEEYAQVSENLGELPGINAIADWERNYPFGDTLKSLVGNITTQERGLPKEKLEHFLTRGYSRNDRVGISGLEKYYEDALRGRKEQIEYITTKDGTTVDSRVAVEGQAGKDLVLTIDMEFQKKVDKVLQEELQKTIQKHPYQHQYMSDAAAVVMNPKTGALLAVSGVTYDRKTNDYKKAPYKAFHDAHLPGSAIKGATVLAGYESGVISPGQVFNDRKIQIASGAPKGSYSELGPVDDYAALRRSSNVYMFYIALKMGGEHRYPFPNGESAAFDVAAWDQMRSYFQQFGLGNRTGIDYPYESTGVIGDKQFQPGLLMDYAIGQYDNYTALQLVQYVSTIANDGNRVRPQLVKEIRNPSQVEERLGSVYQSKGTEVLNRIDMDKSKIERIQEGFRQVFNEPRGTAVRYFGTSKYRNYKAAGKTGTAQNAYYKDGEKKADTENLSLVGYAPYDDPEMAFAIIVPHTGIVNSKHPINQTIGQGILDAYFSSKED
ncbi:penicillin-binding protein [Virgibacillus pantothenticus]|uniref:peptidoglycan D,D-transpeptidase FtsI family protein n=1 Tax=Virgibacillus pantothenticus TaxID=1473 RepID=UPI001B21EA12|nr:penicillin-binding protein 2 [Virgibacillus pantothenticus]GIP64058.1 penicillin-binding protein [Virgibacillus pantothenticus]